MEVFTEYSDFGTEIIKKGFTVKEKGKAAGHVTITLESSLNLNHEQMPKVVDVIENCLEELKKAYGTFDK